VSSVREKLWAAIHRKRLAYLRTFCDIKGDPHASGRIVLADLKRFCGINRGGIVVSQVTRMADPIASAYRAGMRDVYLRIVGLIDLDETRTFEEEKRDVQATDASES
jgi:CRISPR/Cas system-associated endonuclease Cas3-HD